VGCSLESCGPPLCPTPFPTPFRPYISACLGRLSFWPAKWCPLAPSYRNSLILYHVLFPAFFSTLSRPLLNAVHKRIGDTQSYAVRLTHDHCASPPNVRTVQTPQIYPANFRNASTLQIRKQEFAFFVFNVSSRSGSTTPNQT